MNDEARMNQDIEQGAADGQLNVYAEIADRESRLHRPLGLEQRGAFVTGWNAAKRDEARRISDRLACEYEVGRTCQECGVPGQTLGICIACSLLADELCKVPDGTGPQLVRDYVDILERLTGEKVTGEDARRYYKEHGVNFNEAKHPGATEGFVLVVPVRLCQCGLPEDAETHDENLIGRVSSAHEFMLRKVEATP